MIARFWGVRGSVPTSLMGKDVKGKIMEVLRTIQKLSPDHKKFLLDSTDYSELTLGRFMDELPFVMKSTYGGATSCVEIEAADERIICDMGTGARPLGNSLFKKMRDNKGLRATFCVSHVHWDHVQGLPFFGPLYQNKNEGIENHWTFYGGTNWLKTAEECMRGQMDPPYFPVSWAEIYAITHKIITESLHDRMSFNVGDVKITTRKLDHPQETYGFRIEHDGKIVAYTTDNEPRDPREPYDELLELAQDADVWITDCQYTHDMYIGKTAKPHRRNWGHSYPEAVAATAMMAGVKRTILFHHDPGSSDEKIEEIVAQCRALTGHQYQFEAAYEGLEINL
jgi:phosphoribosyl 1,2-cyclic phosphodiesterase